MKIERRVWTRLGIVLCVGVMLMRPMIPGGKVPVTSAGLDVVFVVDTTLSMAAEDYAGEETRLEAVKKDVIASAEVLGNVRFALVSYGNVAQVVMPLTRDVMTLKREVGALWPENSAYARGTSLKEVKEPVMEVLAASEEMQKDLGEVRKRAVIVFSDGELTREGEEWESFAEVGKMVDGGVVLGYGTTQGGQMKGDQDDYYIDGKGYVLEDYEGKRGVSKIDEASLKKLAGEMGVAYLHAENHGAVKKAVAEVAKLAEKNTEEVETYTDIYYIFAVPLLILLAMEFLEMKRRVV